MKTRSLLLPFALASLMLSTLSSCSEAEVLHTRETTQVTKVVTWTSDLVDSYWEQVMPEDAPEGQHSLFTELRFYKLQRRLLYLGTDRHCIIREEAKTRGRYKAYENEGKMPYLLRANDAVVLDVMGVGKHTLQLDRSRDTLYLVTQRPPYPVSEWDRLPFVRIKTED